MKQRVVQTEIEKRVLKTLGELVPLLSKEEQENLMAMAKGAYFIKTMETKESA